MTVERGDSLIFKPFTAPSPQGGKDNTIMATLGIAVPLLPGKTQTWLEVAAQINGPRRKEMDEFHKRVGITTENWYLQQTPQGDLIVLYLEGNIPQCFEELAKSDHPFDLWLKQVWLDTEGIDFGKPLPAPPPDVIYESSAS